MKLTKFKICEYICLIFILYSLLNAAFELLQIFQPFAPSIKRTEGSNSSENLFYNMYDDGDLIVMRNSTSFDLIIILGNEDDC